MPVKQAFKKVVGSALAGATLTTGIGMFVVANNYYDRQGAEITRKLIDMTSLFTSHMSVWTTAITLGAIGWYAGKYFDDPDKKFKARGMAAALGISLIAASFAWPVGDKIYDAVHDSLTTRFNKPQQASYLQPAEHNKIPAGYTPG